MKKKQYMKEYKKSIWILDSTTVYYVRYGDVLCNTHCTHGSLHSHPPFSQPKTQLTLDFGFHTGANRKGSGKSTKSRTINYKE